MSEAVELIESLGEAERRAYQAFRNAAQRLQAAQQEMKAAGDAFQAALGALGNVVAPPQQAT